MKNIKFNTKSVKLGSFSAALIAVAVAAAVIINLLAARLPDSVNSLDLTANNLYSIGEETETMLDGLKDDVDITVLATEDNVSPTLVKLLNSYEGASKKIKVKYEDPTTNMDLSDQYGEMTPGSLIVSTEKKTKAIDLSQIFVTDYSAYYSTGTQSTSFDGEGQITSAISYVTSEDLPKLYTVVGHGETAPGSLASSKISQQNIETADLNLMTVSSIPEDCDCLLINAPQSDYTEEEANMILSYLNGGGKVLALSAYSDETLDNFNSILKAYGIDVQDGVVMEGANYYYQYPIYVLATLSSSEMTDSLLQNHANVLLPYSLGYSKNEADGVTVTDLMTTSSGAYLKKPDEEGKFTTLEKESGEESGQFSLACLAAKGEADSESGAEQGELIAISAASLIDDNVNQSFSLGNMDFFGNCLSYLCSDEDNTIVSIPTKSMSTDYLTVPAMHTVIWAGLTILLIPLVILIAGLVIWLRRRKK